MKIFIFALLLVLTGCTSAPAPQLSPSQRAEQDRRYDVVIAKMKEAIMTAGRCVSAEELLVVAYGLTSSAPEGLVVQTIATRRAVSRGEFTKSQTEPFQYGLPEFGACV